MALLGHLVTSVFRSEERERGWELSSKMTFSEGGIVNERHFITGDMSKLYVSACTKRTYMCLRCNIILLSLYITLFVSLFIFELLTLKLREGRGANSPLLRNICLLYRKPPKIVLQMCVNLLYTNQTHLITTKIAALLITFNQDWCKVNIHLYKWTFTLPLVFDRTTLDQTQQHYLY